MIERLTIEGYRGFEKLSMEGLGRVNLLVGKNNSGKTSVLEAVRLLASGGGIGAMADIAEDRGEALPDDGVRRTMRSVTFDPSHFFRGHQLVSGSHFSVVADDGALGFSVDSLRGASSQITDDGIRGSVPPEPFPVLKAEWKGSRVENPLEQIHRVSHEGLIVVQRGITNAPRTPGIVKMGEDRPTVVYVPPGSLPLATLASIWAHVFQRENEDDVYEAMRVVDGSIRDLNFLPSSRSAGGGSDGVVIKKEGLSGRVPLASLGDGVRRMLALSLALATARGGYLLVDEIDTGLHWSVLADMWKLIVTAAEQNDVQVFATTHSKDCLEALAEAVEAREGGVDAEEGPVVFRVEAGREEAARFDAASLRYAVEQGMELRGL